MRRNAARSPVGRRKVRRLLVGIAAALSLAAVAAPADPTAPAEASVQVPMPPGFRVEPTELEGPVFADSRGHTLYIWPSKKLRNGYSGEMKGKPACYDQVRTETAGSR